jgi:hypothetical protein
MSKAKLPFQVYTAVKVVDEDMERHNQVGVVVGYGAEEGEVRVKFESEAETVEEDFAESQLQGL